MNLAFDDFFRSEFVRVARAASLMVGDFDLGQELGQEAFVRLLVRWEKIESADHARRLVHVVVLNLARSHLRRRRRLTSLSLAASEVEILESGFDRTDDISQLAGPLRNLSTNQRLCVILVDYLGFHPREAADFLGITSSTVRVHLTRARRRLANELAE